MGRQAFTLIELLVAATIVLVLSSLSLVYFTSTQKRGRDARRQADLRQIQVALQMYYDKYGYYPNTGNGYWTSAANLTILVNEGFLPKIPTDPKNQTPYTYQYKAVNPSEGIYLGYNLAATLESEDPDDECAPKSGYNWCLKNP